STAVVFVLVAIQNLLSPPAPGKRARQPARSPYPMQRVHDSRRMIHSMSPTHLPPSGFLVTYLITSTPSATRLPLPSTHVVVRICHLVHMSLCDCVAFRTCHDGQCPPPATAPNCLPVESHFQSRGAALSPD